MKNKKINKIPAASFGTWIKSNGGNIADNAGEIVDVVSSPFQTSTATTGGEAAAQSIAGVAKGASLGFKVAGPWGALVGAGVGAIGKKGQEADMTSFTDYDEGTLGTGLIGAFTNRGLRKKRRAIKKNAYNNRAAVQGTDYLQGEVYDDMIGMNSNAMADGGISSSPAYVDDGELLQTPEGTISKVPERGKPTDSNLVNLPNCTKVLSDKLTVPGRKETFAQLGEKMMTKKKSKYNDRFAENAAKLNEMNNNMIYDQLFDMQESLKQSKGIKPKTKSIQAAASGDTIGRQSSRHNTMSVKGTRYNVGDIFDYNGITYKVTNTNEAVPVKAREGFGGPASTGWPTQFNPLSTSTQTAKPVSIVPDSSYGNASTYTASTPVAKPVTKRKSTTDLIDEEKPELPFTDINPLRVKHPELLTASNREMAGLSNIPSSTSVNSLPKMNIPVNTNKPKKSGSTKLNLGDALSSIASLAPIMFNLFAGKPEKVDAVYNPYATSIMNTMRGRRYDITPALEDLTRNRATSNYNAGQFNTNTGANLAYRLQSAVNADRAIANLRSQESNINNQYLADYANTMNSLGQQWVNATNMAADANAQNRAASRNINRTGISQLSQWAQNRELMRNQRTRDEQMWPLYERFLQAGFTADDLSGFAKYKRGRNV